MPTLTPQNSADLLFLEASKRGISCARLDHLYESQLEHELNGHIEYTFGTQTRFLSKSTSIMTGNKSITNYLLNKWNYPQPKTVVTNTLEEAVEFLKIEKCSVIKPTEGSGGSGVTVDIDTKEKLSFAWEKAQKFQRYTKDLLVQKHILGKHYRVLVINYQSVFVLERVPAHIVGDDLSTIAELVGKRNQTNLQSHNHITIDTESLAQLKESSYELDSIPPLHELVFLKKIVNMHTGATSIDVTDLICEQASTLAIQIAKKFSCPVLGIDCISPGIETTLGLINELNSAPGIVHHHYPTRGQSRNAASMIIDMLFPETIGRVL